MRAKFIYESLKCFESLQFQRGGDPKQVLNIGKWNSPIHIVMVLFGSINDKWNDPLDLQESEKLFKNWSSLITKYHVFYIEEEGDDSGMQIVDGLYLEDEVIEFNNIKYYIPKSGKFKTIKEYLGESHSFIRSSDPMQTLDIGIEYIQKRIENEIDLNLSEINRETNIASILNMMKFVNEFKNSNEVDKIAIEKIIHKINDALSSKEKNYFSMYIEFLNILDFYDILWDPKNKWINSSSARNVSRVNRTKFQEYALNLEPNKIFMLGIHSTDYELIKYAIERGADNLNAAYNLAIRIAAEDGQAEIVKSLLKDPKVDASTDTPDGKRYNTNEKEYPIRVAARNGHIDVVKELLKIPSVDPSYKNNFALKYAIINSHKEIVKLLLLDKRVVNNFGNLPMTIQTEFFKKYPDLENLVLR